jgi:hypothetical protein
LDQYDQYQKLIYPSTRESLFCFLRRKKREGKHVSLCPYYNTFYDEDAAKQYEIEFKRYINRVSIREHQLVHDRYREEKY